MPKKDAKMKKIVLCLLTSTLTTSAMAISSPLMQIVTTLALTGGDVRIENAQLVATPSLPGDTVAFSIAAHNQTIVLGAYRKNYPGNGADSGALYVFDREGTGWAQSSYLAASDGAGFDYLGWAVDIENDVIAAGATWANETGIKSGGVYIYRHGKTWTEEALIVPSDLPEEANFGHAVDLDGARLIVGAPYIDEEVNAQGVVYIFRDDGQWTQEARLTPGDLDVNFVGGAVAIDGNIAVIGAPRDNGDGVSAGSVFIYQLENNNNWTFVTRLSPDTVEPYSYFGNTVSIEGNTILVGAEYSDEVGTNTGAVFVFESIGAVWSQTQVLTPNDKWAWAHFGGSIDLRGDILAIGAYGHPTSTGASYLFERAKDGTFVQVAQLLASDGAMNDRFGNDVAVGSDFVAVGAPFWTSEQGAAYVFDLETQPFRNTLKPPRKSTHGATRALGNQRTGEVRSSVNFEYFGNFDGHDYFITTEVMEYYDAHEMANVISMVLDRPASLATINSREESDFVQSINLELLWIGLSDLATESIYEWDSGEPLDWTDWGNNEPNKYGGTEDVVVMNWSFSNGKYLGWNDWKEQYRYAAALIEIDGEACNGDADFDHDIDGDDLAIIIATWGDMGGIGDVNHDGAIDITDLLWLLDYWGACP